MVQLKKLVRLFNQNTNQRCFFSTAAPKVKKERKELVISCKRKTYDHYYPASYDKLSVVRLASQGWTHSKAKGDFFTVHPVADSHEEPYHSFQDMGLPVTLIEALKSEGISKATDFQRRAMEMILTGSHVMLAAETGCGKTLAYLLPILQNLAHNKSTEMNAPKAVVIVPNRELAYQAGEVAQNLGSCLGVNVKTIVGGKTKQMMMHPRFEDVDLLVATPGVLSKLSTVGVYKLDQVRYTVLDEADTLMDDSFLLKLTTITNRVPQSQIILVSATLPKKLPDVLAPLEPSLQYVISQRVHKPLLNITQKFLRLTHTAKVGHLLEIAKTNKSPLLIFTNTNQTCNWVSLFLNENGVNCANINGDMNYALRIQQWNRFVSREANILSATDVGSRGLNTIQVRHVLNYDFPQYAADYIHRIGRVGRLGSPDACKVTNFVTRYNEIELVQQIELAIRKNQPIENVDGNITRMVQRRVEKKINEREDIV